MERHFGETEGKISMGIFEFYIVFRYESFKNKKNNIKPKLTKYKRKKKSCLREKKEAIE